jgi:hypothetical protein
MRLSTTDRTAIWLAWKKRCAYTGELLTFKELDIDHILPVDLASRPKEFSVLRSKLGLPASFELDSLENYLPCDRMRNRQKGSTVFNESAARYFLQLARERLETVKAEVARLTEYSRTEFHLAKLAAMVDNGSLSIADITEYIEGAVSEVRQRDYEPLVVTVGVGPGVFEGAIFYAATCDDLEYGLSETLRAKCKGVVVQTEASARSGESLSVRFAIWHVGIEDFLGALEEPWDLLEVAEFRDIYAIHAAITTVAGHNTSVSAPIQIGIHDSVGTICISNVAATVADLEFPDDEGE